MQSIPGQSLFRILVTAKQQRFEAKELYRITYSHIVCNTTTTGCRNPETKQFDINCTLPRYLRQSSDIWLCEQWRIRHVSI